MNKSSLETTNIRPFKISNKDLFMIFALYILLQLIFSLGISLLVLTGKLGFSNQSFGTMQLSAILFFSFGIFIYLFRKGRTFVSLLFQPQDPLHAFTKKALTYFKYGLITLLIAMPLTFITERIVSISMGLEEAKQGLVKQFELLQNTPLLFFSLGFIIALLPPLIEEIIFRGYLQSWIKQRWGKKIAIIFTSIIFTFFHFESSLGIGNVQLLSALFVMAIFLSMLRERYESLWAPIGLHVGFNGLSVFFVWFSLNQ